MLPAGSRARTAKVWLPTASPEYDCGVVQAAKAAPSREHSKVALPSFDVKVKVALVELVAAAGCPVMVVSGATVSTVHENVAGVGSTLPAESVARTWKVWPPCARPL